MLYFGANLIGEGSLGGIESGLRYQLEVLMALLVKSRDSPSYSEHTRVHWRTFFIRGKSRTPESRMEIEESRSRWEFWREATQPVREAIVLFSGGFDILDFWVIFYTLAGWVCLLRGSPAPRQSLGENVKGYS